MTIGYRPRRWYDTHAYGGRVRLRMSRRIAQRLRGYGWVVVAVDAREGRP